MQADEETCFLFFFVFLLLLGNHSRRKDWKDWRKDWRKDGSLGANSADVGDYLVAQRVTFNLEPVC